MGIFDPRYSSIERGKRYTIRFEQSDSIPISWYIGIKWMALAGMLPEISTHPVLNGGSGSEEHPTQAMLDLYTMKKEKKNIDGLKICILGDLKYGRTVYSLLYGLIHYNVEIYLVSPPSLRIRQESIYGLTEKLKISELTELDDELLSKIDVLYVTRIQRERFPDIQEYEKVKGTYIIDSNVLNRLKPDASIMHPMPRVDEISKNIDLTKNAIYFKQVAYGKELQAAHC